MAQNVRMSDYMAALLGGMFIGLSATLLMLFNGRVLGVSGIVGGIFHRFSREDVWRYTFLLGLFTGGAALYLINPHFFQVSISRSNGALILAGLLVGIGTQLGGGCTSGHGVCGISRLSRRSILATVIFMGVGALFVSVIAHFWGGSL